MSGDYEKKYGQLLAKAWLDDAFRAELLREPKEVLRNSGFDVPDVVEVTVVEMPSLADLPLSTPDRFVLVLPDRPSGTRISDEELARVAGGDASLDERWRCHYCKPCML